MIGAPLSFIYKQMEKNPKQWKYGFSKIPVIGDWLRTFETGQRTEDMMKFYGINWDDVKYPTLLDNSSLSGFNPLNTTTNAIQELYEIDEPKTKPVRYNRHGGANTFENWYYNH